MIRRCNGNASYVSGGCNSSIGRFRRSLLDEVQTCQWSEVFSSAMVNEVVAFFVLSQRPVVDFCPGILHRTCAVTSSLGLPVMPPKSQLPKCSSSKSSSLFESASIFFIRSSSCCKKVAFSELRVEKKCLRHQPLTFTGTPEYRPRR